MIIEYHNARRDIGIKAYHDCKTVRDFIVTELPKIGDKKEKFFYIIRLKNKYMGNCNMLLYFQDGKVKSHHSAGAYFSFEPVLDYELVEEYLICELRTRNILSYDLDYEPVSPVRLRKPLIRKKYDDDYLALLRGSEKDIYLGSKVYDSLTMEREEEITRNLDKNKYNSDLCSDVEKLLIKQRDEISTLKLIIRELESKNERKKQQLKWAKKILGEKEDIHDIESRYFKGDV